MNKLFFDTSDNFENIIKKHYPKYENIIQIETGWTNFVYKVKNNNRTYFFRFPRNDFFSKALEKEYKFINFISNKISLKVPKLRLYYHNNRPYSLHKGIEGKSLSDCYNFLSDLEKTKLSKDISKLILQFSKINIKNSNFEFEKVSDFLDNLSLVSQNNYDINHHNLLKQLENQYMTVSHGDLNPGNMILKNNKLVAIIDFAFAGISSPLVDLSRVVGRTPNDFKNFLLPIYEKTLNSKINLFDLEQLENTWKYIEEKYILYIKQNHPSIKLPTLI